MAGISRIDEAYFGSLWGKGNRNGYLEEKVPLALRHMGTEQLEVS